MSAGDCTGRILIWHGLQAAVNHAESGTEGGTISCTTVHWHSGPVRCLAFNLDSTYLLSGGDEAVLVQCLNSFIILQATNQAIRSVRSPLYFQVQTLPIGGNRSHFKTWP